MMRKPVSVLFLAVVAAFGGTAFAQTTPATSAIKPLNFTSPCPGGGTRAATGSWNSGTGALSMSVKVTNCKWDNDELQSGTRTVNGTLLVGALRDIKIDLTMQEDFTVTRDGTTKLTHSCTVTKKGTLDDPGDRFTGTITRKCSSSGEVWDPDHWVENIMRHTLALEVPKQSQGKTPSPRGPGNACGKPATNPGQGNGKDKESGGTSTTAATGTASTPAEGEVCGDN
jgi:hypothetical protein